MAVAVHVKMKDGKDEPVYYALTNGVKVGPAGELTLVSECNMHGVPLEYFIYAPGTWSEVSVSWNEAEADGRA